MTINDLMFPPSTKGGDGGTGGGGEPQDGAVADAMVDGSTGICTPTADTCNGVDDNCNGIADDKDPEVQASCEAIVLNAASFCSRVRSEWTCVPGDCNDGFANCDGDPSNGCEPFCTCNACPDSGAEDGGAEDAGGP